MQVVTVSLEDLKNLINKALDEKITPLAATINTGDELGKIGDWRLAQKLISIGPSQRPMSESAIKKKAALRRKENGIPCVIGRGDRYMFSSVAIKMWQMGKSSPEVTAWLESKLNLI